MSDLEYRYNINLESDNDYGVVATSENTSFFTVYFSCGASDVYTKDNYTTTPTCPVHKVKSSTSLTGGFAPSGTGSVVCPSTSWNQSVNGGTTTFKISIDYNGGTVGPIPSSWKKRVANNESACYTTATAPVDGVFQVSGRYAYGNSYGLIAPTKTTVDSREIIFKDDSNIIKTDYSYQTTPYTFLYWHSTGDDKKYGPGAGWDPGYDGNNDLDYYPTASFGRYYVNSKDTDFTANWEAGTPSDWTSITLPSYSKTGYTFNGWYDGSTKIGSAGSSWKPTKAVTLTASLTPDKYTVTYNSNGGSGTMDAGEATYDSNYTPKANDFTRTGYKFTGWNTAADGTGMVWSAGIAQKWTITSNTIFYAQWVEKITPTILVSQKTNLVYNGTAQQLLSSGAISSGSGEFAISTSSSTAPTSGWSSDITAITATNHETYYLWWKSTENADYKAQSATYTGESVTIDQANPDVSAWITDAPQPVKITKVTTDLATVTPTTPGNYQIRYSLDEENWTNVAMDKPWSLTNKPKIPNGAYTVQYSFTPNDTTNYKSIENVEIGKVAIKVQSGSIYIIIDGKPKEGQLYIKHNGEWHEIICHVMHDGKWNETTSN